MTSTCSFAGFRFANGLPLRLQLRVVGGNERADLGRHVQQFQPLFFVQRHGKAAHAIDGNGTLFTNLHGDAGGRTLFEGGVFVAQSGGASSW